MSKKKREELGMNEISVNERSNFVRFPPGEVNTILKRFGIDVAQGRMQSVYKNNLKNLLAVYNTNLEAGVLDEDYIEPEIPSVTHIRKIKFSNIIPIRRILGKEKV